jgi:hypothetical protein
VTELEDDNGTWVVVGEHPLVSDFPPNMTPNGLNAVFSRAVQTETGTAHELFGMTRASTAEWFGEPVKILANGEDTHPQLLGQCQRLYTVHDGVMRRYDR